MAELQTDTLAASRFLDFTHEEWGRLRASTPLTLSEADLQSLLGINEKLSLPEVAQIYLPLSRLLNLYVAAIQTLHTATSTFVGTLAAKVPYIIGIGGSVAVGKSTTARVLQALLARWPGHPKIDLVTTDGFLLANRILEERGLMSRKGFPESYDVRRLITFLADVKSGCPEVTAPVYSHALYDIVPGAHKVVRQPDVMIIEGLNVLQTGDGSGSRSPRVFVSDFFDFSIYVDADEDAVKQWYVERFLQFRETRFRDPASYFHQFAHLSVDEATDVAHDIWREINGVNLRDNILPTRERANLVLEKDGDHTIRRVRLRRL